MNSFGYLSPLGAGIWIMFSGCGCPFGYPKISQGHMIANLKRHRNPQKERNLRDLRVGKAIKTLPRWTVYRTIRDQTSLIAGSPKSWSIPTREMSELLLVIFLHFLSSQKASCLFSPLWKKHQHDRGDVNSTLGRYKKGGYFHGHFKDGKRNGEARNITAITQWRDKMTRLKFRCRFLPVFWC